MLIVHVLNVEHGSSVIVEYDNHGIRHFGVIDSNARTGQTPKALTKLRQLGATKLSFVCLTHPHADHFSGLYSIINAFPDAIEHFYSCPMGELFNHRDRLKKLIIKLNSVIAKSDGMDQRCAALEFAQILIWADGLHSKGFTWNECKGDEHTIAPPGFNGVDLKTILPSARVVGAYVQRLLRDDQSVIGHFDDNEISLALELTYAGRKLILGGDGTEVNWQQRRRFEANSNRTIVADVANLSHHGSKNGNSPAVLTQIFGGSVSRRVAVTSANGQSHPDLDVIKWLQTHSIEPYCTNLMPACGANTVKLLTLPNIDPELARWVREVSSNVKQVQTCQGDIRIEINHAGAFDVIPEVKNVCAFRGDYDLLFGLGAH